MKKEVIIAKMKDYFGSERYGKLIGGAILIESNILFFFESNILKTKSWVFNFSSIFFNPPRDKADVWITF